MEGKLHNVLKPSIYSGDSQALIKRVRIYGIHWEKKKKKKMS